MDEAPLLGGMSCPEDEMVTDLFSPESQFVSENMALKSAVVVKHEEDEFHVFKDAYLGADDAKEPLLHAFNPALGADCKSKVKVELLVDDDQEEALGEYPGLQELQALDDAVLPAAPQPQVYNVHFLSSLLTPHRSPTVVPLGAWARDGAANPGVRMIPVELKEPDGTVTSNNPEEATFQNPLVQESCCKFPPSQEPEDTSSCSQKKDSSPMLDNGALPSSVVNGSAFPSGSTLSGPPKITLAGVTLSSWDTKSKKPCNCTKSQCLKLYCDCFASGDFCNNCNCNNCCNNLRHEIERFKAIKACLDRNPEAFQPKIGKGKLGDVKPRHNKGCNCKRSGCLKNYCECYEGKIMCSSICKCIGCKNYEESPERKTLMNMPNFMEIGDFEGSHHLSPTKCSGLPKFRKDGQSSSCISWEVVEATCACLLAQGEEAEKEHCSECLAEQMILEEFGRCLSQILHIEFKSKGLTIESSTL
ncbi:tesmin isoform X4 [Tupaia chinensis]|uniref:tesmin isoform X4 n=1 Tax=Tupaia chinensis TaxID=246437 RepID=UPI0003C8FE91|nr:tesmin isoform X4 [Tupaia chinensis]